MKKSMFKSMSLFTFLVLLLGLIVACGDSPRYESDDVNDEVQELTEATKEEWQKDRAELRAELDRLDEKIEDRLEELDEEWEEASAEARVEIEEQRENLKEARRNLKIKADELGKDISAGWDRVKTDVRNWLDKMERDLEDTFDSNG